VGGDRLSSDDGAADVIGFEAAARRKKDMWCHTDILPNVLFEYYPLIIHQSVNYAT
jgi:hypothetical protein